MGNYFWDTKCTGLINKYTICPRSSNPFYLVTYNVKWVTTSWTNSIVLILSLSFKNTPHCSSLQHTNEHNED